MFRRHKRLWILLGILAVLVVLYVFFSTSQDPGISGKLFKADSDRITEIGIKNSYGTFSFERQDGTWTVSEGDQAYRTNPEKMELILDALGNFTISRVLPEEIGLYGLNPAVAEVSLTMQDGKSHSFLVGNITVSSSNAYVKDAASGVVGITTAANVAQFDGSLTAYRDKNVFTVDANNLAQIGYFQDGELAASVITDGSGWYLNYPYEAPARNIVMNEILAMIKGWTVAGFPDPEQVTEQDMGLKNAGEALMLVDTNGNTQTLEFGNESGTARFVRTGGEDDVAMLYTVDIDFSQLNAESLLFVAPLRASVDTVAKVEMNMGGKDYVFDVDSGTGVVSLNGRLIDYEDFISVYYRYILLLADGRDEAGAADTEPVAQMKTTFTDGKEAALAILPRDGETYFMGIGDSNVFYMDKERLNNLMEQVTALAGA